MTSKTLRYEREVTSSRQYRAIIKYTMAKQARHCIKDERLQVQDSILLLKTITVARQARHYIRDERLQVEDNILLSKTIIVTRQAEHCIKNKRLHVQDSIFLLKKNYCGKPSRTLH